MDDFLKQAGIFYRHKRTLKVCGKMVVPVADDGTHHCIHCDRPLNEPMGTFEEMQEMHRRNFGQTAKASVAICEQCHEEILAWYRSRQ